MREIMSATWVDHASGPNPIPNALVVVRFRDGLESKARRSDGLRWEHHGLPDDVVSYRVLAEDVGDA